ncbi:chaperonin: PROVISIONAL [Gigaspora margarita]|uniref:Chaperonin: PROVISIONAL n=1 Tax=Gigaspora margarita TaxID=4874 RepID=A0A8H4ATI6_GIGMA|nr:chaperonin: PROVISIONAL [Gigaspora margarita]
MPEKGANIVISLVHNYFLLYEHGEKYLTIHANNCPDQNKNNLIMAYLAWQVIIGYHDRIKYSFMIAGHTKFSPDSFFGLFKLALVKLEVDDLDDLVKVVKNLSTNKYNLAQTIFDKKENQVYKEQVEIKDINSSSEIIPLSGLTALRQWNLYNEV